MIISYVFFCIFSVSLETDLLTCPLNICWVLQYFYRTLPQITNWLEWVVHFCISIPWQYSQSQFHFSQSIIDRWLICQLVLFLTGDLIRSIPMIYSFYLSLLSLSLNKEVVSSMSIPIRAKREKRRDRSWREDQFSSLKRCPRIESSSTSSFFLSPFIHRVNLSLSLLSLQSILQYSVIVVLNLTKRIIPFLLQSIALLIHTMHALLVWSTSTVQLLIIYSEEGCQRELTRRNGQEYKRHCVFLDKAAPTLAKIHWDTVDNR